MWTQEAKLQAEEPRPREWAGFDVDLDGSMAVVGAPSFPADHRPGRVFLFEKGSDGWDRVAELEGDHSGDLFGFSVAIDNDRIVVGAPHTDTPDAGFAGGVHVYERTGDGSWTRTALFAGSDSTFGDEFGSAVALDGATLAVGARADQPHGIEREGSAYVFEHADGSWAQTAKLVPDNPDERARFGHDLDVDGETILVGVRSHDGQANAGGTAFVFERDPGSGWEQTTQLWPSDPGAFHRFGASVSLDGSRAAIGAPGQIFFNYPGAAYIFERGVDGAWTEQTRLEGDGDEEETFGESVDLEGARLVVGAQTSDELDWPDAVDDPSAIMASGAAFVFEERDGGWAETAKVMAEDRGHVGPVSIDDGADLATWDVDRFGAAVALDGDAFVVGAMMDDTDAGDETGSAYVFTHGCDGQALPSTDSPPAPPCLDGGGGLP